MNCHEHLLWKRFIYVLGLKLCEISTKVARHFLHSDLWLARIQCPWTDVYLSWERTVQSEGHLLKGIKTRSPLSMTPSCKEISSLKF